MVSMPFKRAGLLQQTRQATEVEHTPFQCHLSGQVCCNVEQRVKFAILCAFQCPLSGLVGCNARHCG